MRCFLDLGASKRPCPKKHHCVQSIDPSLVGGAVSSINYRGDAISPKAARNAAKSGLAVLNDLSLFEPFHGTW